MGREDVFSVCKCHLLRTCMMLLTRFTMAQTAAACCGLYAYRPTRGSISKEGVTPIAGDLDAVGWICRTPAMLPCLGEAFRLPGGKLACLQGLQM